MPELPPVTMTILSFSPAMIFPPENVDLVRVYRIAGRLSIRIAGLWKSTGINLRKFLRRLASLFYTTNAN